MSLLKRTPIGSETIPRGCKIWKVTETMYELTLHCVRTMYVTDNRRMTGDEQMTVDERMTNDLESQAYQCEEGFLSYESRRPRLFLLARIGALALQIHLF